MLQQKTLQEDLESQLEKEIEAVKKHDPEKQNIQDLKSARHKRIKSSIDQFSLRAQQTTQNNKTAHAHAAKNIAQNDNLIENIENIIDQSKIDNKTKCKQITLTIIKFSLSTLIGGILGYSTTLFLQK